MKEGTERSGRTAGRTLLLAVLTVLAAAFAWLGVAAPAQAGANTNPSGPAGAARPAGVPAGEEVWLLQNAGTGFCLSSDASGSVYTVPTEHCGGINNHYWIRYSDEVLQNVQTGRCLSSNGNGSVYTVKVEDCGAIAHHFWRDHGDGRLSNRGTSRCLSSNGDRKVYTVEPAVCGNIAHHYWFIYVY